MDKMVQNMPLKDFRTVIRISEPEDFAIGVENSEPPNLIRFQRKSGII